MSDNAMTALIVIAFVAIVVLGPALMEVFSR